MENPDTVKTNQTNTAEQEISARSMRHEYFARLYVAACTGAVALGAAMVEAGGTTVPQDKLKMFAGIGSLVGGSYLGNKAISKAVKAGAERHDALSIETRKEPSDI